MIQTTAGRADSAGRGALISVIIPHLNQPQMLARCLASLAAGTRVPDEIIVVDNGSADLPEATCAAHPSVTLLQEPTPGPGPARNTGIAHARGDILAFIDADCLADPAWLAEAEAAMADPEASILGGDVRIAYVDSGRLTVLEAYESIYAYRMDRYIAREGFTGTGNLVIRPHVFADVGPFAGIGVAEDRDWGQRATAKGYRIRYVGAMRVYHPARETFDQLRQKWDRHMAHDYARDSTSLKGRVKFAAKTLAMSVSPVVEVPRILVSDRLQGLGNKWRAFKGLARIRAYRTGRMTQLLLGKDAAQLSGSWNR